MLLSCLNHQKHNCVLPAAKGVTSFKANPHNVVTPQVTNHYKYINSQIAWYSNRVSRYGVVEELIITMYVNIMKIINMLVYISLTYDRDG